MFKGENLINKLKNKPVTEELEQGDVNKITDVAESLHALMKKAIPNIKKTSAAQAAMKACEKACDDFISIAAEEVTESATGLKLALKAEEDAAFAQWCKDATDDELLASIQKNSDAGNDDLVKIAQDELEARGAKESKNFRPKPKLEAKTGDALLAEIEDILKNKTAKEIDGTLVDLQTANIISQVANGLSPENKTKFLAKGIVTAATVAWKLVK